jgi:hypothetical protein
MANKRLKRPRDPVQLAKLMVDILTGQTTDSAGDGKYPRAVERGRKGGLKGGAARAGDDSRTAKSLGFKGRPCPMVAL